MWSRCTRVRWTRIALKSLKPGYVALASRAAGDDGYEFALENQAGVALHLSEDDRRALVTGLALHEKAKKTLAKARALAMMAKNIMQSFWLPLPCLFRG